MHRPKTYKSIALTMAILMFFTSMGFSIDMHYCKDQLKSFNFFGKAETCHQGKVFCPIHDKWMEMDGPDEVQKKKCCSNKTVTLDDLDVDYTLSYCSELTDIQVQIITSFVYSIFEINNPKPIKSKFLDLEESPPQRDIYALYESFLI